MAGVAEAMASLVQRNGRLTARLAELEAENAELEEKAAAKAQAEQAPEYRAASEPGLATLSGPLVAAAVAAAVEAAETAPSRALSGAVVEQTAESKAAEEAYVRRIADAHRKLQEAGTGGGGVVPAESDEQKREEPEGDAAFNQRQLASHAGMVEDGGASEGDVAAMVAEVSGVLLSVPAHSGHIEVYWQVKVVPY